ncbi:hypothetical protein EGW08_016291 [Elysia chlorotica]|uniref:F-box domain-containing protein n=1 Tax=Elysia chlorotica TaxID=188477 RepID=A0A3S1BVM6_ELYCH|nr:hypothetical protein EGW08_016291 [Elysia chlorotica]
MNNHNHNNHHGKHSKGKSEEKRRKRRSNSKNGAPPSSFDWTTTSQYTYEDDALLNKKLPKELLLRIFSFLDVVSLCRCAQVSKYWNMLALDGSNWQKIDLFNFQTVIEGPVVEYMSQRCGGFLKSLSLKGCQSITDAALQTFAQQCKHIETLILHKCMKITDVTCEALGKYSKKLRKLDLSSCCHITDKSLKHLRQSKHCPLYFFSRTQTIKALSTLLLFTYPDNQSIVHFCFDCRINNEGIEKLAICAENLMKLNIRNCSDITDEAIATLGLKCPGLTLLCASLCNRLTDASLVALGQGCPELTTLEVSGCNLLTDAGFQALTRNCHNLEKMDLEDCLQITDATLSHIAAYCHHLNALSLSHCELITDEGIRQLGSSPCAMEHLQVLELDNCPLITDAALEHLMGCQSLTRIEIYDCQLITCTGIRRLRSHLPHILVHAYFAPVTPPPSVGGGRQRYCKCCAIL